MRYALRRLGFFVLTLWVALTLNFLLPRLMPGNPAEAMMTKFHSAGANPQTLKALETLFGVNNQQGLLAQYVGYLHQMLTGNFGTSLSQFPASVSSVIGSAIWWTGVPGGHPAVLPEHRPQLGQLLQRGVRPGAVIVGHGDP